MKSLKENFKSPTMQLVIEIGSPKAICMRSGSYNYYCAECREKPVLSVRELLITLPYPFIRALLEEL